jgi:hypothetical protein
MKKSCSLEVPYACAKEGDSHPQGIELSERKTLEMLSEKERTSEGLDKKKVCLSKRKCATLRSMVQNSLRTNS